MAGDTDIQLQDFEERSNLVTHSSPSKRLISDNISSEDDSLKTSRPPKVIIGGSRGNALLHFSLFHAIPLGFAIFLIVFNVQSRLFKGDSTYIPWLQFAAKIHEATMQMSIVMVMVAYLQRLLTHKRPVPFGSIFFVYQLFQLGYLWSPEFWGSITAKRFPGSMKSIFVVLVVLSTLMVSAVGPSSAIAMQPRLVNFTAPDWSGVALNVSGDALYPKSLDKPNAALPSNENDTTILPASAWSYLQTLPTVGSSEETETGLVNISHGARMPKIYPVRLQPWWHRVNQCPDRHPPRTLYLQYAPNSTFATVQHMAVAFALQDQQYTLNGYAQPSSKRGVGANVASIKMPQAYASVVCELNSIMDENDDRPFSFPDSFLAGAPDCKNKADCESWRPLNKVETKEYTKITRKEVWKKFKKDGQGRILWVDDIGVTNLGSKKALGAIVVQPELCEKSTKYLTTSACVIGARWENTTTLMKDDVSNPGTENELSPNSLSSFPRWSQSPIHLSSTWATNLDAKTATQNRNVVDNALRGIAITDNLCPERGMYSESSPPPKIRRPFMHEGLLASLIVDGLAGVSWPFEIWREADTKKSSKGNKNWTADFCDTTKSQNAPPEAGTRLTFQGQLHSYAWTTDGTSIKLALAVLALYCVYVSGYVLHTLVTARSSLSFSSLSDIVALAINSAPAESINSAGTGKMDVFRKPVTVREVADSGRVELLFDDRLGENGGDEAYRRIIPGRAYS